jgi:hypothetical protein
MTAASQLRRILPALDKARANLADLERKAAAVGADFSYERGYCVPLRLEQIRYELDRG